MKRRLVAILLGLAVAASSGNAAMAVSLQPAVGMNNEVSATIAAVGNGDTATPYFNTIVLISGHLTSLGNTLNCGVSVTNRSSAVTQVKMQLQRKSGSSWSTIKTWNKTYSSTKYVSATQSYTGSDGYTYRMKYTVTVGTDTATGYTNEKTL